MSTVKPFFGREKELKILTRLKERKTSSLVVVRGRRRIGKSSLIKKFASKYKFFHFEGIAPSSTTTMQDQLDVFSNQLSEQTNLPKVIFTDWLDALKLLWEKSKEGNLVILLDEISWMGSKDSEFLGKLKYAWDNYFSNNPRLMLVICGSASSWIEKNILSHTGFLGRVSQTLTIEELELQDIKLFWPKKNISTTEILKTISVTGGVPKYLEEIDTKYTAEQNLQNLCFTKGGFLLEEFEKIFNDLFLRRSENYKKIINLLASGSYNMTEIADHLKFSRSGRLSEYLNELELSGFIESIQNWNFRSLKDSKEKRFRLKDNYLRFYLKYIEPSINKINRGTYSFESFYSLKNWPSVVGLQFENIILNNRSLLQRKLLIDPNEIICDGTYIQKKNSSGSKGCQIDYLIQTRFDSFYICEIKASTNIIGASVIEDIQQKIDSLDYLKGSFRPVLIHVNGVKEEVEKSDFFYKIINFNELLEN